ncbi:hypothetical protein OPV22_004801 [Ensete ventricosum]|uniref:Uncharacterized protein n=1 Tax=Ensete ventricosum TaxID=4639 RepID=A0AAV8RMQ5_ENSVE|nr:hypothetical protein OPV22_004801 [Ensete ventricosum]
MGERTREVWGVGHSRRNRIRNVSRRLSVRRPFLVASPFSPAGVVVRRPTSGISFPLFFWFAPLIWGHLEPDDMGSSNQPLISSKEGI